MAENLFYEPPKMSVKPRIIFKMMPLDGQSWLTERICHYNPCISLSCDCRQHSPPTAKPADVVRVGEDVHADRGLLRALIIRAWHEHAEAPTPSKDQRRWVWNLASAPRPAIQGRPQNPSIGSDMP